MADPYDDLDGLDLAVGGPLELPAEMMFEMAKGMEDPAAIAERYGITGAKYEAMVAWEPFKKEIERLRVKLEGEGYTFRNKALLMATDVLDKVYTDAKRPDITPAQRLEAAKWLAKMADLEPKNVVAQQGGGSFSFQIVINKDETPKEVNVTRVIDQKPVETTADE